MTQDALQSHAQNDLAITRESAYGSLAEPTYAGITSFMRRRYSRDARNADVAVLGLPYDGATSNRPGARFGPRAIRTASTHMAWARPYGWESDVFEQLNVIDYGDCLMDPGHPETIVASMEQTVAALLEQDCATLCLGGDHFCSYPVIRAYARKYGALSLVHFDAHSDTWAEPGQRLDHGSMFFHAAQQGLIDPARSVQVGMRTVNEESHGFTVFDAEYLHEHGVANVLHQIRDVVGSSPVYLSFDVDFLDPSVAPGTGTPVIGGFSGWQGRQLVRGLRGLNVVGMDVMEVSPAYDVGEITALAAATIAVDMLGVYAGNPHLISKPRQENRT